MTTAQKMIDGFRDKFEYEDKGCSECGGSELIDKTEVRYPKGEYYCEVNTTVNMT
jgi:hypothetical protein